MKAFINGVGYAVCAGVVFAVGRYAGSFLGEALFGDKDV